MFSKEQQIDWAIFIFLMKTYIFLQKEFENRLSSLQQQHKMLKVSYLYIS